MLETRISPELVPGAPADLEPSQDTETVIGPSSGPASQTLPRSDPAVRFPREETTARLATAKPPRGLSSSSWFRRKNEWISNVWKTSCSSYPQETIDLSGKTGSRETGKKPVTT